MKKFIAFIVCVLTVQMSAKDINENPATYGKWTNGDVVFKISKNGFVIDRAKMGLPDNCKHEHSIGQIAGSELIKNIQATISGNGEELEIADPEDGKKMINLIEPNTKYTILTHYLSCGDGAESFILLNDTTGIFSEIAPIDVYSLADKVSDSID